MRGLGDALVVMFWLAIAGIVASAAWAIFGIVWAVNHLSLTVTP